MEEAQFICKGLSKKSAGRHFGCLAGTKNTFEPIGRAYGATVILHHRPLCKKIITMITDMLKQWKALKGKLENRYTVHIWTTLIGWTDWGENIDKHILPEWQAMGTTRLENRIRHHWSEKDGVDNFRCLTIPNYNQTRGGWPMPSGRAFPR